MIVFREVCDKCGYIMLFSTQMLSRPGCDRFRVTQCPGCGETLDGVVAFETELDIPELEPSPDVNEIRRAIAEHLDSSPLE